MKNLEIHSTHYRFLQEKYRDWMCINNYRPLTVNAYTQALQEFFHYLEQQGILHISGVRQQHLTRFKGRLLIRQNHKTKSGGIRNMTINGIIKGVNCFVKFFNESSEVNKLEVYEDYLPSDVTEKTILTQSEVMELYEATFEQYENGSIEIGQRDRVMIGVFYGCGLRLNEVRNLNISDIDFLNKKLLVRNGKGRKQRYVPIPNKHLADIQAYIQQGRDWFKYYHKSGMSNKRTVEKVITRMDEDALFLTIHGTRLKSFQQRLDFLKQRTSIDKHFGTHTLRHSLATHLLQNGWELEQIGKLLGHASIDSTQIYVHIVEKLNHQLAQAI